MFTTRKELWINVRVAIFFATVNCTVGFNNKSCQFVITLKITPTNSFNVSLVTVF